MGMKKKLSAEEQIKYMSEVNGIRFNIVKKEEAEKFIKNNTYFFKIKSYAKNFEKYNNCKHNRYINLEFAYLKELSTLDMHLRKLVLKMTLDIEHSLKVRLINDITDNDFEDGYQIVQEFFKAKPYVESGILTKSRSSTCKDLIEKYHNQYPVWSLVEILSFGEFIKLYELYYRKYPVKDSFLNYLWSIKYIRNASAHNNCLLNSLRLPYSNSIRPNKEINTLISKFNGINKNSRKNKMKNPMIHDLVVLIITFEKIIKSEMIKKKTFEDLKYLFDKRFMRNKEYFSKNDTIKSYYQFVKIIIDETNAKLYN